jgi:hypothetical protein
LVAPWHQKPDPLWYVSRRNAKGRNPGRSGNFPGRETGRRNAPETVSFKTPQSGKIREVSGKRNGKGETDYQKTRSPGSIREEKREEMGAL